MKLDSTQRERQRWWHSWCWSVALHAALMVLLIVQALWIPLPFLESSATSRQAIVVQYSSEPITVEMAMEVAVDERPWMARDAVDPTYAQVDLNDPRWHDILTEPLRNAAGEDNSTANVAASSLISDHLRRSIEASSRQSDESNLNSLGQLSERLTDVSSEETIDELSGTLSRLVGTKERASQPKEGVAGEFDYATAQPDDCRKETIDGAVKYFVVMIDAEGRTQEIEVDEASGEQLYKTMQIVKSNPLLERVYRGVVMGLLDKLLQPAEVPTKSTDSKKP